MVAVCDTVETAGIQYHVIVGAGLDTTIRRLTVTQWERVRADLATLPDIKILDVRTGRRHSTAGDSTAPRCL